ncbi:E3 ubiquitin-protein ligase ubr1, partial [Spiromyces aspiralis]
MCSYCFKTTDHEGHDTSFCVNSGTGGCCDCGDPDAWQVKLVCQYHGTKEELAAVGKKPIINRASSAAIPGYREDECPEPIAMSIRETVAAVCEFMLETMATSPRIHKRVHREEEIIDDMVQTSRILGGPDDETLYSVVLWNDETHSFHDVIDLCMAILGCDKNRARVITENVHRHGREVIKTSSDLSMLLTISELLSKESIYVSIRSARDVFREQLSAALLLWLQDIAQGSYRQLARVCRSKVNDKIRYEVSRQLCTPWVLPRRNPALAESLVPIIAPPMYFEYDDMYEDIASNYTPFEPSQFGADMSSNNNNAQNNHAAAVLGFRASASTTDPTELEDASPAHPQQQQQQQQQAGQTTQLRGLRRLRSDSTDSLRQQGEER